MVAGWAQPYWDADCKGAIYGLTRKSGPAEIAKAALESVAFQTKDLLMAMSQDVDLNDHNSVLRVDGGMSANDWTMQFLSDLLGMKVDRPRNIETTAFGAAWLAGQGAGIYPSMSELPHHWKLDRCFKPSWAPEKCKRRHDEWRNAVARTLSSVKVSIDDALPPAG